MLVLTPQDFNFEKSTVKINKSLQRINKIYIVTNPKTKKSNRTVVMPHFLVEEMQGYISRLYGRKDNARIFMISKSYLHHEMERGCKATNLKKICIHDLKHSHISLLIDRGFNAVRLANRIGYKSIKITYLSAHIFSSKDIDIPK